VSGLEYVDLTDISLYEVLKSTLHISIGWASQRIMATVSNDNLSKILNIPVGSPLLSIERILFDTKGLPIEFAKSHTKADYPLALTLRS
jgi:GntR family transcriptional regulator